MSRQILFSLWILAISTFPALAADDTAATWPVVYEESFDSDNADRWEFADPKVWKVAEKEGVRFLSTTADSDYKPAVRSPQNIAWIKDLALSDFILDATVRSTQAEYGHRDVCFLFGKQDASHFYYVHLATKADDHANSVFLVNGEPRVSIAQERTDGTKWTEDWHHVRIIRNSKAGDIVVFFDDMKTPIMRTVDTTFGKGSFGFGAFDDTADLKEIVIRGQ